MEEQSLIITDLSSIDHLKNQFSSNAKLIFDNAFETKNISTTQINNLLTANAKKGFDFSAKLTSLTKFFTERGIIISYSTRREIKENAVKLKAMRQKKMIALVSNSEFSDINLQTESHKITVTEEETTFNWHIQRVGGHKILEHADLVKIITHAQAGDNKARSIIVNQNQKLVVSVAKKFLWSQLDIMDLIQDGNIGLLTAIEKFDVSLGFHFSTYAIYWIRQAIQRSIQDTGKLIRIPVHVQDSMRVLKKLRLQLTKELGREPTEEELVENAPNAAKMKKLLLTEKDHIFSLDGSTHEDEDGTMKFDVADKGQISANSLIEANAENAKLGKEFTHLIESVKTLDVDERNKEIFFLYHRLDGNTEKMTLEKIGSRMNVTRERIRQIIEVIWKKLETTCKITKDTFGKELRSLEEISSITHTDLNL